MSKAPELIIVKQREFATTYWEVWYKSFDNFSALNLQNSSAKYTNGGWHTVFSSNATNFSVGQEFNGYSNAGAKNVTYAFHSVPGFSKIGTYSGNGSTDGPFVHAGFRPKYVMVKRMDATEEWMILDSARDPMNGAKARLFAQDTMVENPAETMDFLSNGFKLRRGGGGTGNVSGGTYLYVAFAEAPFGGSGVAPATAR
ncbi:MAG: hypothetical protein QG650_794 [Patescibacteria group bacterium]|nr:hypothetical protein [Patescibacteria group bacterium]